MLFAYGLLFFKPLAGSIFNQLAVRQTGVITGQAFIEQDFKALFTKFVAGKPGEQAVLKDTACQANRNVAVDFP